MKIFQNLTIQVLICILAGVLLGHFAPQYGTAMKPIADTFIAMIKMLLGPIIFLTIVEGVGGAGNMKQLGRIGGKSLLYFELVTTFALIIGLVVANFVKPGVGIDVEAIKRMTPPDAADQIAKFSNNAKEMNWVEFFTHIVPNNIIDAFAKGDILQILFFSVLFGVAVAQLGETGKSIVLSLDRFSKVFFKILAILMKVAPLGAFGAMAFSIGKFGIATLIPLGKLILCVYSTMFLFVVVILNLIARYYGFNIFKIINYIKEEILIVLGTSSSETVLPRLMDKLEHLGCNRQVVGLVVPTGYSFNLDGTTIYLSMAVIFLAQANGINLSLSQEIMIIGVLMLTSKGAAAVVGSAFVVLVSTLSTLKVVPIESVALLLGVDRFMSEARAVTNLIGNTVATLVIAKSENAFHPPLGYPEEEMLS